MLNEKFSIALVVASKGRFSSLMKRIPIWSSAGFDEVIIVGKYKEPENSDLKKLCKQNNITFIEESKSLMDTRSKARNDGAKAAHTEWIFFGDDDDEIIAKIDRRTLANSTAGKDWLVGKTGDVIVFHRRESFLKFGGYPEDMVSAEDEIMSNRARLYGKGGFEGQVYKKVIKAPPKSSSYTLTRAKNHFWYGFTFLILFLRTPQPRLVIQGEIRRFETLFIRLVKGDLKNIIYICLRVIGYLFSPLYILKITLTSGIEGVKREPFASWQGLR